MWRADGAVQYYNYEETKIKKKKISIMNAYIQAEKIIIQNKQKPL